MLNSLSQALSEGSCCWESDKLYNWAQEETVDREWANSNTDVTGFRTTFHVADGVNHTTQQNNEP